MTTRCPRCGRNNYGDVNKCSFCGSGLKLLPGEDEEAILTDADVQEKLSKLKGERIRNPYLIAGGGSMLVIGVVLAFIMYAVIMFIVFNPDDVEVSFDNGQWNYEVVGEEYIHGEITKVAEYTDSSWERDHGYKDYDAYEINGDQSDTRRSAYDEGRTDMEPNLWVYSSEDLGSKGDRVLIKVKASENDLGESRAVYVDKPWWGQSGWIFILPGIVIFIIGAVLLTIGIVGRTDKSIDRLLEEDAEFRRQQLNMIHAAKIKAQEEAKRSGWGGDIYAAGQPVDQTPPPGAPGGPQPLMQPVEGEVQQVPQTGPPQPAAQQQQPAPAAPPPQTSGQPAGGEMQQAPQTGPPQPAAQQQQPAPAAPVQQAPNPERPAQVGQAPPPQG